MAIGAKLTAVSDFLFRRLFKFLFRYDVFISYARRDGKGYALKLKEQLTRLDFSCFLDYDELPAGNSLNRTLKRAIKKSAAIILIGTEGALKSHYVNLEVGEFAATGRAIIPIDFEGTLTNAPWPVIKERDLVWVDETKDALAKNTPSPPVADAVDKLFKYTRRNVRVRGQVIATAALFLLGAAIAVVVIRQQVAVATEQKHAAQIEKGKAEQEQKNAVAATLEAKRQEALAIVNADKAERESAEAIKQTKEAQKQSEIANAKTIEARKQGEIARTQTAEAVKQATIARAKAEEARQQQLIAEAQQKLASSRELAANAVSQLQVDPELSLVLAGKSAEAVHTFEAEDALRRALLESHVRAVMEGHRGEVTSASFTADGEFAVLTDNDNAARVLRLSDGQIVAELRGHTQPLRGASFSPDGQFVVTASDDRTARIWDWRTQRVMLELPQHPEAVNSVRFSPDGAAVITLSDDNAARVWDAKTGRRLSPVLYGVVARMSDHNLQEVPIKPFTPDGRHIFFASANEEGAANRPPKGRISLYAVRESVWDVKAGRVLSEEQELHAVSNADVNVQQKIMVTNGTELRDLNTGIIFARLSKGGDYGGALSPNGKLLVTANKDNTARVWEVPVKNERVDAAQNDNTEGLGRVLDAPKWTLAGHRGPVRTASFSPDGRFILTASDDRTARVWDVTTGQEVSVLRGHRKGLLSAAFSPDGSRMVTAGDDRTARVWDAGMGQGFVDLGKVDEKTGGARFGAHSNFVLVSNDRTARVWNARAKQFLQHTWPGYMAALGPAGKLIVTANQELPIIYDAATGRVRVELQSHGVETFSAAYSPDNRFIATAASDNFVRVRDAESGKELFQLPVETKNDADLSFSPGSGNLLLIPGHDKTLLWEWKTKQSPVELQGFSSHPGIKGEKGGGVFSSDGRLVAGKSGNAVAVWETQTGCRMKIQAQHRSPVHGAVFSHDGRSLLSTDDYAAKLWQLPAIFKCDGQEQALKEILTLDQKRPHSTPRRNAVLSPDGKFIVLTAYAKGAPQVWDATLGELKFKLGTDADSTHGVAFNSDGRLIVTASEDGQARVWDSVTGKLLRTLEGNRETPLSAASFSPDDKLIVTISDPRFNVLTVWDAATGKRLREPLRGRAASFSPDSNSILTISGGDVASVSSVSDGRAIAELQGLTGKVTHLAFSDDGLRVIAATSDRRVGVWAAESGRNLARRDYAGDIQTLSLSPDGKSIATTVAGEGNTLGAQVWNTETDKVLEFGKDERLDSVVRSPGGRYVIWTPLAGSAGAYSYMTKVSDIVTGDVRDLAGYLPAFSHDGRRMVTVSDDIARVWDTGTWEIVAELRGHTKEIKSAAFSPDGQFIVTASDDQTALVWDAETGNLETGLFGDINYGLASAAFSPDGASILVIGKDETARLYACVLCGSWDELRKRERERLTLHPRPLTPGEQKKFTRQTPQGVASALPLSSTPQ
jgi:WD40 repeat protein